jgi:MFS family permease
MTAGAAAVRGRAFHGWAVVAAAFVITAVGFGSAYTFGAFAAPLQAEFGASRGSATLVFALAGFLYFSFGCVSGPLADRIGARPLAVAGMLLTGAGLVAASRAASLQGVYAAYGLGVGLGIGCAYVPVLGAVQRWFSKRRGLASGLAVTGIGAGTLVLPPLAALLIARLGWRDAYLALGIGAAAIGTAAALLIENDPAARGQYPDGAPYPPDPPAVPVGRPLFAIAASRPFAQLYAATLLAGCGAFVPFVHLVPYATDRGAAPAAAAALLGMIGVGSTAGRFLLGGLTDYLGRSRALVLALAGMAALLGLWPLAHGWWPLAAFALAYGAFYGGWVAVLPAVCVDRFGSGSVGGVIGLLYTAVAIGTLAGPSAVGFAFDRGGSYALPIEACAAAGLLATALAAVMARGRQAP